MVTFDTETVDDGAMIDLGAQPTRVTIPSDGWYIATAGAGWQSTATYSARETYIRKNGATPYVAANYAVVGMATGVVGLPACAIGYYVAGDYLEVGVLQGQGSTQSMGPAIWSRF